MNGAILPSDWLFDPSYSEPKRYVIKGVNMTTLKYRRDASSTQLFRI